MSKRKREDPQEEISSENVPFKQCEFQYRKLCDHPDWYACYLGSFASSAKADFWNYDKNACIPRYVTISSGLKFWFTCNLCFHHFESATSNITRGGWCPYCAIPSKKLCADSGCATCYNRSFASYSKRDCWNYNKNTCTPRDVMRSTNKKFWFTCNFCFHDFESAVNNIIAGQWCPYCSTPCKKLCNDSACTACYSKSFASCCEKRDFWNYDKNTCTPRDVTQSSHQKFWFSCDVCLHDFESVTVQVTTGSWCPYCSTPCKKLCIDSGCGTCYNHSFASSAKRDFWNYDRNAHTPREIGRCSALEFWFTCNLCSHDFESQLNSVTTGSWCPYCSTPDRKSVV